VNQVIKIQVLSDGSLRIDSRGVNGSESEIKKLLDELSKTLGGDLEIEKHEHGLHGHHHQSSRILGGH
jgi:hypothetical protein